MSSIWNSILDAFTSLLGFFHGLLEPIFGVQSWGWAIILLTIVVRVALLPLAVKQTRSMRAMQELAPKIKKIQKKYPTDREMMREDPEKYRARKAKVNEETMALYKEAGVNPAGGCLPLIAQMPIFFALFSVLRGSAEIRNEPFYFFTTSLEAGLDDAGNALATGLGAIARNAGTAAYLLIAAMAVTMFISQRQTMSRTNAEGPAAQQQKIMLYVMPAMLAFFGTNLPLGVLLYWVTTNIWQMGQQYVIYRDLAPVDAQGADSGANAKPSGAKSSGSKGSGSRSSGPKGSSGEGRVPGKDPRPPTTPRNKRATRDSDDTHVPKRTRRGQS